MCKMKPLFCMGIKRQPRGRHRDCLLFIAVKFVVSFFARTLLRSVHYKEIGPSCSLLFLRDPESACQLLIALQQIPDAVL